MSDHQEGYADGLAGAGMQPRIELAEASFDRHYGDMDDAQQYADGFELGSIDRKAMLARQPDAFAAWCSGLIDMEGA
jgi:hypothetical protein